MGKRVKVAFVQVAVYEDEWCGGYVVEQSEWFRGKSASTRAWCEIPEAPLADRERKLLGEVVLAAVDYMVTDALTLDGQEKLF